MSDRAQLPIYSYSGKVVRTDVSFGVRHPVIREPYEPTGDIAYDRYAGPQHTDAYDRLIEAIEFTADTFLFGDTSGEDLNAAKPNQFEVDGSFIIRAIGGKSKHAYEKPYSVLKRNGQPAISLLERYRTAQRRNRRAYGWTDNDILRIRKDMDRSLGRIVTWNFAEVMFDAAVLLEPETSSSAANKTSATSSTKVGLIPASPWREIFEQARDVCFRALGKQAPDAPVHLNILRLSRSVTKEDAEGLIKEIKIANLTTVPPVLQIGQFEFYESTVIK